MAINIKKLILFQLWTITFACISISVLSQYGWKICNTPDFRSRVDDIFMVNDQIGYAVCGDGQIVKTINGGNDWITLVQDSNVYCRSVEFLNTEKGFVGSFGSLNYIKNILRRTDDGGATWTDLTMKLDPAAWKGICGLSIADTNTIYGCGNWYQDSAYMIKSIDGGNNWSFIDMHKYATSLIDMCFINKDTGFATGRGPSPLQTAVILYTTDGGINWTYKFQNTVSHEYCWKIQRLTDKFFFASIEDVIDVPQTILKSIDGGMNWQVKTVSSMPSSGSGNIEGVGFINPLNGWTGGGSYSYETKNGGETWSKTNICPAMNRVFKVNDSLMFATGYKIWKYRSVSTNSSPGSISRLSFISFHPNPVNGDLTINLSLSKFTHAFIGLFDNLGRQVRIIENTDKVVGVYQYTLNTNSLAKGIYFIVLKTHDNKQTLKILINH